MPRKRFFRKTLDQPSADSVFNIAPSMEESRLCDMDVVDGACSCMRSFLNYHIPFPEMMDSQSLVLDRLFKLQEYNHCECALALHRRMVAGFSDVNIGFAKKSDRSKEIFHKTKQGCFSLGWFGAFFGVIWYFFVYFRVLLGFSNLDSIIIS